MNTLKNPTHSELREGIAQKSEIKIDDRTSKNIIPMNDLDKKRLKECILFRNWNDLMFKAFLDEKKVYLKKFK